MSKKIFRSSEKIIINSNYKEKQNPNFHKNQTVQKIKMFKKSKCPKNV